MTWKWEEVIKLFKIPMIYRDVSIDTCSLLPKNMLNIAKKWVDTNEKKSIIFSGQVGCGKTYLSIAMLRGIVEKGCPWFRYQRAIDLDRELRDSILDRTERDLLEKYSEAPILFIDDLGIETGSNRLIEQYFSIIDARVSNNLTTVYTTNLEKKGIKSTFGDRISSRLETCEFIIFPEKDLRKRGS